MEVLQGSRGTLYVKDGFFYTKKNDYKGVQYLKCRDKTCNSRAIMTGIEVKHVSKHNHPPDEAGKELFLLKSALKWEAKGALNKKAIHIFKDVCKR